MYLWFLPRVRGSSVPRLLLSAACAALVCAWGVPVHAADALDKDYVYPIKKLQSRVDLVGRAGTQRNIGSVGAWVPLVQGVHGDDVFYTDIRYMGDDQENREGNLGFGYRRVVPEAQGVLGGHVWIDRRRSESGMLAHQLTAGAEYLGEKVEVRGNVYIPLSNPKRTITPNIGSSNPYLADTGIFVDTNGETIEEPLGGFDLEVGVPVDWQPVPMDQLRVFAGMYDFRGDYAPSVTGVRLRAVADITPDVSVGVRLQKDDARLEQGFVEATLRLPLGQKLSHRADGLRAKLDDAPERDVDIVTNKAIDTGLLKPVLNATTNEKQRVLYVDNTAAAGGTGSKENPFNTLAQAEAALQDGDVLYIARGDGTSTGMDQGLNVARDNVQIIGEGVNFTWSSGRFSTAVGGSIADGTLLRAATAAPVITNTQTTTDATTGNGIYVTGAAVDIAGLSIANATNNGLFVFGDVGKAMGDVRINHVTSSNNAGRGFYVLCKGRAIIDSVTLENNTANNNTGSTGRGIEVSASDATITAATLSGNTTTGNANNGHYVTAATNGLIGSATVENAIASSNASIGMYLLAQTGGDINTLTATNNSASANTGAAGRGIYALATGADSTMGTVLLENNITNNNAIEGQNITSDISAAITNATIKGGTSNANAAQGYLVFSTTGASIGTATLENNIANNNTGISGRGIELRSDATITTATLTSNTTTGNSGIGQYVRAANSGTVGSATIQNATASTNSLQGISILAQLDGDITNATVKNSISGSNTGDGVFIQATGAGSTMGTVLLENNVTSSNTGNGGQYINAASSGGITSATIKGGTSNSNVGRALWIYALTGSTIGTATIENSAGNNSTGSAGRGIEIRSDGTITTTTLTGNTTTGNETIGQFVTATSNGLIGSATIQNATTSTNTTQGIYIFAQAGGDITNATIKNSTSSNNTSDGIFVQASTSGSTIGTVLLENNITNNGAANGQNISSATSGVITSATIKGGTSNANAGRGYLVLTQSSATTGSATLENNTGNNNTGTNGRGIEVRSDATITTTTLTGNITTGNAQNGQYVTANTSSGLIGSATIQNATANTNAAQGLYIFAQAGGDINALTVSNNTANSNTGTNGRGIQISTSASGSTLGAGTVSGNRTNNNAQSGISITGASSGVLTGINLTGHTATGNATNGVIVDDDTTGAFVVDMGGGSLSGAGQNRIFSNTGTEIFLDYDTLQMKAENNWWGVNTGLAGGEVTLNSGTLDSTPFLTTDPNP